eukprot:6183988-Pleurochrysis_carterae.AAC.1
MDVFKSTAPIGGNVPVDGRSGPRPTGNLSSTYLLAGTKLSDEEKLQVALCRRQCWRRAAQTATLAAPVSYAAVVIYEAIATTHLPRGSRIAVPLGAAIFGSWAGSIYGAREGASFMAAILTVHRASESSGA